MSDSRFRPSPEEELDSQSWQEVSCTICDSIGYDVVQTPTRQITDPAQLFGAASGLPGTQRLVRCHRCEFVYENPRCKEEIIRDAYTSSPNDSFDDQHHFRVRNFQKTFERIRRRLPKGRLSILDVGTAGGAFLEAMSGLGHQTLGIEANHFLAEKTRGRGLDVIQGTIEEVALPEASFDVICFWDVLEHLARPKEVLKRVQPLLKVGGSLLISFPNHGTWQARVAGKHFLWIPSGHLHHFNARHLTQLLQDVGYAPLFFQRHWQTLPLGYLFLMARRLALPGPKWLA